MLPQSCSLANYYHEAFRAPPEGTKKKTKKKTKKFKVKSKYEMVYENDFRTPPELEIPGNPSAFAVFASIRLTAFDRWMRQATQEFLQSSSAAPIHDQSEFDSDTEDNSQSSTYIPFRVSKVVGIGLRSVFELIKESRMTHPALCTKALNALLDVLQGQSPEGLKSEPSDVIDPLFDLLLDLACMHGPETSVPNDGTHLTAIACACLLSLVVVRGDTGKYLAAAAALLMCPRALSVQNIQMPSVLSSLQKSVQGVLLGKAVRPNWVTHGVLRDAKVESFPIRLPHDLKEVVLTLKSMACDGQYLYIFTSSGLIKVGTGYGGTLKGHVYFWKPEFYPNDKGTLVFCGGNLYLKLAGRRGGEFLIVERSNCLISGRVPLHSRDEASSVVFSDGENLGTISPARDDGFVVRMLNQNTSPASLLTELPLKLARKCVDIFGPAPFDEEGFPYTSTTGNEEEVAMICSGKEFGLIRTVHGKVLYSGKPSSLGIKQAGVRTGKWAELTLTKSPKVKYIAVGHEGSHGILLTEDGSVFFVGTARRGEDGDQCKVRRQPKALKPKKMIKVEGHFIVSGACNNGSTALITKDGDLLMFGKDTQHADPSSGLVPLKNEFVVQVALGKAHAVVLTAKGQIYTFGYNNKFQCGHDFSAKDGANDENSAATDEQDEIPEDKPNNAEAGTSKQFPYNEPDLIMCPDGMHTWHDAQCMICTVCKECTGYSVSCLSSLNEERNPGQECGCGEGDSGCSVCGCCRICASEVIDNSELADVAGVMRLDLIFRSDKILLPPRQRSRLQEQLQARLEDRKRWIGIRKQFGVKGSTKKKPMSPPKVIACGSGPNSLGSEVSCGSESETNRASSIAPTKLQLPVDSPVVQIAAGLHHSVLLLQNGEVYTFGSNLFGQLGCGDILAKNSIQRVDIPGHVVHIAAGSNHTVVLTSKGEVYTFGNFQKGQLARDPPHREDPKPGSSSKSYSNPQTPWYCIPTPIPKIGPKHGRRATWVGASGDQTFLKIDESLINSVSISKSIVTANKQAIVLLPTHEETANSFKCLVIKKRDGHCLSFKDNKQVDFVDKIVCMDPIYNVLWCYNPMRNEIACYNIIASELQTKNLVKTSDHKYLFQVKTLNVEKEGKIEPKELKEQKSEKGFDMTLILSPELSLPVITNCHVTRFQAAINLLCCLDTLTIAHDFQLRAVKEEIEDRQFNAGLRPYTKDDFVVCNRFENHGGGWGYSGHSVEAIRFMPDTDVLLGGFGIYGGRGEYTAKVRVYDIGPEGGEHEGDGDLLAEIEELQYECGPRQKYAALFEEPVALQAHRWYVAWLRISGPSSDCGSAGQSMVNTEDQVLFYFKSSKKSNNGTDVNAGQIPQILYKVITSENRPKPRPIDPTESVHVLSRDFSRTVTKECFASLLSLLQWSWNTFKWGVAEGQSIKNIYTNLELERLVYISRACLRLIQAYILEIYPNQITKKIPLENVHLAESVGDVRTLLRQILSDNLSALMQSRKSGKVKTSNPNIVMMNGILEECHNTFVACFHAFYPTAHLKWTCLCDLLSELEKETSRLSQSNSQRLLSAVLSALCAPSVRLRSTFPLLSSITSADSSLSRGLSPSDNSGLPIMGVMDSHYYPILVEQMSFKTQVDGYLAPQWQWKEVLKRLFQLVSDPIYQGLRNGKITPQLDLTRNSCHLLARVLAELVHQCNANEEELQAACGGRIMHMTSSRFLRINQSRSWNTGNGSPDAISFHVDRPGISIVGVGIYSGMGHYDYELELLEDQGAAWGDTQALPPAVARPQRWVTLETAKGTFIPEELAPEIIEIRFEKAVPIKENTKYAIRLRNHGGRTNNGDGGVATVRGSDNTTFTFSTCSLSFNGTTIARGQIPILLYYSLPIECLKTHTNKLEQQSRKVALDMTSTIIHNACEMMSCAREKAEEVASAKILSDSYLVTTLMPLMLAHVTPLASDPRSAVNILSLIQEILPHVSALNLMDACISEKPLISSSQDNFDYKTNTTSHQYTWLQSDHPYKPASVSNYRITFPESVKWITLEFDPNCSTAQPEDSLQLYIPSREKSTSLAASKSTDVEEGDKDNPPMPYWPVLHRFTSWYYALDTLVTPWPLNSIVLPGNEVIFSLETASDYLKDEKTPPYGFKCLIVGYEWPLPGTIGSNIAGLKHLEAELSFLGGLCARNLMKKEMQLPVSGDEEGEIDVEIAEEVAQQTMALHGSLLSKGLALSNPPSIQQALDGLLPYSAHSNERLFLRDFVNCVAGSSGGRLAQWLQPGSRVDPAKCEVVYAREEMRCGWPAIITVLTRDQYSDLVNVPDMSIEVKAMPIDKRELGEFGRKMARVQEATYGGLPVPPVNRPFEPTIQHKASFQSISAMKAFQNYSFEEVRFASPPPNRPCERMLVKHNGDGTFTATWTPSQVGHYAIFVNIDGYEMEETFQVEVKDPPQGITPPNQAAAKKTMHQPSRLRKFVAKNSAGLRVRAHPSLLSEQIGIVHVNGTIAFMDELHNDDGVWLRLTMDTIRQYCNTVVQEAWCMQYNQHLGKTLLLPVEEPKSILDKVISDTFIRKLPEIQGGKTSNYQVIKCGASGHNIRSRPSLRAPPVGMLVLGNRIGVTDYTVNSDGYWVLLDQITCEKFCFKTDGEAWSLAIGPGPNHTLYLGSVGTDNTHLETELSRLCKRGFDFSGGSSNFSFASTSPRVSRSEKSGESHALRNPFVFGDSDVPKVPKREKKDSKLSSLPKWFKAEDGIKSEGADLQQGSNGNGITPPGTPKRCHSPRGASPKIPSRGSSPVPIPPKSSALQDSSSGSSQAYSSSRSIAGISPLASGAGQDFSARRGSTPSDTCALVSSITCDLSASSLPPQEPPQLRELPPEPPSPCDSSRTTPPSKSEIAEPGSSPKTQQTGTQTSPENLLSLTAACGHFSIGSVHKDERILQKLARIERATQGKSRPKRSISPAKLQQLPSTSKLTIPVTTEAAKPAMSPSVAESLRAVFAAFLWHEGIVHDAMACASFLKFHPTLPKQGALSVNPQQEVLVDKRRQELSKEERARQRHSVEVSNAGNYLHIQPSTLESLTRSAANACANRKKNGKYPSSIHEEAGDFPGGFHAPMSVLPPALKSLVYLWEELTTSCMQIVSHQLLTSSPVVPIRNTKKGKEINAKNDKEKTDSEAGGKKGKKKKPVAANPAPEIEAKAGQKEKEEEVVSDEPDTQCELCGEVYPYPVTFHMLQSHPGCGKHAEGKGYNSGGTYCLGWAGNCGDGGKPNSSWYLLCEPCREKYTKNYRGGKKKGKNPKSKKCLFNKDASTPSTTAGLEPHVIMKNNAMFLLDLQSSAESGMSHQRRPSSTIMPSVSENNSPPDAGPFSPMPPFQCLQSLGSNLTPTNEPEFYEKVLRPQNSNESSSGQRPLSEISISSDTDSDAGKGMRFHRSVSMGTNGIPWSKTGLDGRIVMMRKRNNSSSEIANEGGSSLLCNPSSALQKLVPKLDSSSILKNNERNNMGPSGGLMLLQRPIMLFLMQQHDLDALQLAMKQALRKAMCRVYGMQALNWLIRSVTQPICLHDLLWWFVTAHTPPEPDEQPDEDNKANRKIEEQDLNVCEHPLSDITIAGDAVHPLPGTFHALLQTIADLMVLLPMGSALQQMAVRCWGLRFAPTDHSFLHRSQVFSNISKILSRSEELEDCTVSMHESHQSNINSYPGGSVECLKDLTSVVEIKASSRQAMIGSLTDGSTETFWESGDEDKNKTKSLTLVLAQGHHPHMICVHVDNCRDLGQKVSSITFYSGPNSDELLRLRVIEVETRLHGGWLNCPIFDHTDTVIRMELKGPDNSVRVRQIRILGNVEGESLKVRKLYNSATIQQRNCEAETLRVFRLITALVFGKLLMGTEETSHNLNDSGSASISESIGEPLEESNDLKEHMVGILFSRSKLTHLQKQVIVHIVMAIRKETARVRDEWELMLCSSAGLSNSQNSTDPHKNSDTYCFEMLSMVLALSGSLVGRTYIAYQGGLIGDLLSLLHTGSARVQRQVTSLLRRILPEITPDVFAKIMGCTNLPPKDFGIVSAAYNKDSAGFDLNQPGILDVFLSVIAKSLTVQVKVKGKSGSSMKDINTVTLATSIHPKDNLGKRWWLRGCVNRKLAEVMIHLIKDMAAGKMSDAWANVTKGAIAENILHLTHLSEEQRIPTTCLRTPTIWLALASLCVLDKDHVDGLSSGQWNTVDGQMAPPRPTCTNHDDGETFAIIQCTQCGNLCADCDRFLHLHRKTRNHQRQVCKEEEEAIKVELHEGCGRTKLFWLLALADSRTLKALIEYREGGIRNRGVGMSGVCRFCGATGSSGLLAIGNVCADHECQEYGRTACSKLLSCGHMCGGILGEKTCLPCLHGCSNNSSLKQDADDMCMICFTEALSCAPAIQLKCGHVFHMHCCKAVLSKGWPGPRITFSFSLCPICKVEIAHPTLDEILAPVRELFKDVKRKALMRLEYEGLLTVDAIVTPGARFFNDAAGYAMDRYAYYVCFKCNKAYYGGEARCDAEVGENYDPTELVCGGCSDVARAQMCPKHGTDFLEYKCRYCCSVAVFFCFGTTHFCNPCHDDFQRVTNLSKHELPNCPAGPKAKQLDGDECPLHMKHPPTGEEFALGCGVCRNAHTF